MMSPPLKDAKKGDETSKLAYVDKRRLLEATQNMIHSPIDISLKDATWLHLPPLQWHNFHLVPKKMKVTNTGYTVILSSKWSTERPHMNHGPMENNFLFSQVHFHWGVTDDEGSEHSVDHRRYPLEMHVVHYSSKYRSQEAALQEKDGLLVVAYFFVEADNPALEDLVNAFHMIREPHAATRVSTFSVSKLVLPFTDDYLLYRGSVLSNACYHQIMWTISRTPLGVSSRQLGKFRLLLSKSGKMVQNGDNPANHLQRRALCHVNPSAEHTHTLHPLQHGPVYFSGKPSVRGSRSEGDHAAPSHHEVDTSRSLTSKRPSSTSRSVPRLKSRSSSRARAQWKIPTPASTLSTSQTPVPTPPVACVGQSPAASLADVMAYSKPVDVYQAVAAAQRYLASQGRATASPVQAYQATATSACRPDAAPDVYKALQQIIANKAAHSDDNAAYDSEYLRHLLGLSPRPRHPGELFSEPHYRHQHHHPRHHRDDRRRFFHRHRAHDNALVRKPAVTDTEAARHPWSGKRADSDGAPLDVFHMAPPKHYNRDDSTERRQPIVIFRPNVPPPLHPDFNGDPSTTDRYVHEEHRGVQPVSVYQANTLPPSVAPRRRRNSSRLNMLLNADQGKEFNKRRHGSRLDLLVGSGADSKHRIAQGSRSDMRSSSRHDGSQRSANCCRSRSKMRAARRLEQERSKEAVDRAAKTYTTEPIEHVMSAKSRAAMDASQSKETQTSREQAYREQTYREQASMTSPAQTYREQASMTSRDQHREQASMTSPAQTSRDQASMTSEEGLKRRTSHSEGRRAGRSVSFDDTPQAHEKSREIAKMSLGLSTSLKNFVMDPDELMKVDPDFQHDVKAMERHRDTGKRVDPDYLHDADVKTTERRKDPGERVDTDYRHDADVKATARRKDPGERVDTVYPHDADVKAMERRKYPGESRSVSTSTSVSTITESACETSASSSSVYSIERRKHGRNARTQTSVRLILDPPVPPVPPIPRTQQPLFMQSSFQESRQYPQRLLQQQEQHQMSSYCPAERDVPSPSPRLQLPDVKQMLQDHVIGNYKPRSALQDIRLETSPNIGAARSESPRRRVDPILKLRPPQPPGPRPLSTLQVIHPSAPRPQSASTDSSTAPPLSCDGVSHHYVGYLAHYVQEVDPAPRAGGARSYAQEVARSYAQEAAPTARSGGGSVYMQEAAPAPRAGGSQYMQEVAPTARSGGGSVYMQEVATTSRAGGGHYMQQAAPTARSIGNSHYVLDLPPPVRPGAARQYVQEVAATARPAGGRQVEFGYEMHEVASQRRGPPSSRTDERSQAGSQYGETRPRSAGQQSTHQATESGHFRQPPRTIQNLQYVPENYACRPERVEYLPGKDSQRYKITERLDELPTKDARRGRESKSSERGARPRKKSVRVGSSREIGGRRVRERSSSPDRILLPRSSSPPSLRRRSSSIEVLVSESTSFKAAPLGVGGTQRVSEASTQAPSLWRLGSYPRSRFNGDRMSTCTVIEPELWLEDLYKTPRDRQMLVYTIPVVGTTTRSGSDPGTTPYNSPTARARSRSAAPREAPERQTEQTGRYIEQLISTADEQLSHYDVKESGKYGDPYNYDSHHSLRSHRRLKSPSRQSGNCD